jgi:hypothetical protein
MRLGEELTATDGTISFYVDGKKTTVTVQNVKATFAERHTIIPNRKG